MKQLKTVILLLLWVTSVTGVYGQTEVNVSASLDSTRIYIGGQVDLTLQVSKPNGLSVKFPQFKDTIVKSIEVVELGKIDTISSVNGRIEIVQKIRITSFDSGLHYIPPIQFEVWSSVSKSIAQTNELGLNVINPFEVVDPKKGFYDIIGHFFIFSIKHDLNKYATIFSLKKGYFACLISMKSLIEQKLPAKNGINIKVRGYHPCMGCGYGF